MRARKLSKENTTSLKIGYLHPHLRAGSFDSLQPLQPSKSRSLRETIPAIARRVSAFSQKEFTRQEFTRQKKPDAADMNGIIQGDALAKFMLLSFGNQNRSEHEYQDAGSGGPGTFLLPSPIGCALPDRLPLSQES